MKLLLVLAAVLAAVSSELLTDVDKTRLQKFSDNCISKTHVTKDVIVKMRNGEFEDNAHLNDYLFCIFKKMGWQKEDGSIVKDKITSFVARDTIAEEAMKPCIDKHESTGPDTAFALFKCYKLNLPAGFKSTL